MPKIIIKNKAAFLDRDGVINIDKGYINNFNQITFRAGVIKGLRFLTEKKYKIFVITNQAGIAKGYIKYGQLIELNKKLIIFFKKKGIIINKIQFCPHHKEGLIKKYSINCKCRKPGNLMIKKIFNNFNINKKFSFMIGDKLKDKQAANKSSLYFQYAKKNFYNQIKSITKKHEK